MTQTGFQEANILGGKVNAVTPKTSMDWIIERAQAGESRSVAYCNVHMIMESFDSSEFRQILSEFDLVNTDGAPLVWVLKLMGVQNAERVTGPDSTLEILRRAAELGLPVGFYGSTPETLKTFKAKMTERFPKLRVVYAFSPPFRTLDTAEDEQITREIAASGARLVFVGLGCPKQERWAHAHKGRIPAVMLCVGAAFDMHAGNVERAPAWMQRAGLEWVHRAMSDPKRLWKRYLTTNPRFVGLVALQLLGLRRFETPKLEQRPS
jgi:N-acetylglucosaminyldiphosphoundecaprenol N-acetyl-beta-D-mannosaminyltransferase